MRLTTQQLKGMRDGKPKRKKWQAPILTPDGRILSDGTLVLTMMLTPSKNQEPSNRYARQNIHDAAMRDAYSAWLFAQRPKFKSVEITPKFYVWALRDEDNNNSLGIKGAIDGLKGNLMPDDSPKYMKLMPAEQVVDRKNQRLELWITAQLSQETPGATC